MSVISYIEKLRTKSENERKKISLVVAFSVTGIIFIIWAFTVFSSISQKTPTTEVVDTVDSVSVYGDLKSRWSALIENMSGLFSNKAIVSPENTEESLYFDALEGIPADTAEIDATLENTATSSRFAQ